MVDQDTDIAFDEDRDAKSKQPPPREPLPTARIAFQKQQQCLRAYGLESRDGTEPVKIEQVAKAVEMHPSTVSLVNPFFEKIGLITKSGRVFHPTPAVLDFVRASKWNAEKGAEKL